MITVYHSPRTRSVRVVWTLEELGVPYTLETLPFLPENLRSERYLRIHPLGKVPAIDDDGLVLFESGAIVEYLIDRYGGGRLAPPPGTAERGRFLQWLHFAEATAMPPVSLFAHHTLFKPEAERVAAVADEARARIVETLEVVEAALAGREYLPGPDFTGADVMLGYTLLLVRWLGLPADARPRVRAYLERLEQRPALQKALAA